ncbi:MAG: hypothetical protein AAF196_08850, partial [Planctomycetota bacterium]
LEDSDARRVLVALLLCEPNSLGVVHEAVRGTHRFVVPGMVSIGQPPSNAGQDWTVIARRISVVPATGCVSSEAPELVSAPRLGRFFEFNCPPCDTSGVPTLAIGARGVNDIVLSAPIACSTPCVWSLDALVSEQGSSNYRARIPTRSSLVGIAFRVQCGCITSCIELSSALDLQIVD